MGRNVHKRGNYWYTLKKRLNDEGANETITNCKELKLPARDGKMRLTDCADTETMLRIIQSVPSPKAEPFKRWLAQVGSERLEEIEDPEKAFQEWRQRAIASYQARGYSEEWAITRVDSIVVRKELTGEWSVRGIKESEYAILTDRLHMGAFGLSIDEHMALKEFPVTHRGARVVRQGNLRDGMTVWELVVTTFAEGAARALHVQNDSHGFAAIAADVDVAGDLARKNRELIEVQIGRPVVSTINTIPGAVGLWDLLPDASDDLREDGSFDSRNPPPHE
jgi:hypothetical protein